VIMNRSGLSLSLALLLAAVTTNSLATAQDRPVAYRGATIWTGSGEQIPDGVVVIAQGRILGLGGAEFAVPEGAETIDVSDKHITPGLVDASWIGGVPDKDANEQSDEVTPATRVLTSLDPTDKAFLRARHSGVTTVHVMPGTRNVIGGMSAIVKTWGTDYQAMLLKEDAALRIVLGEQPSSGNRSIRGGRVESIYYRRPTTRMGVIWSVRSSFYDAKDYMQRTVDPSGDGGSDAGLEILADVLRGEVKAITTARSEQDLRTALRLAEEFGYTPVIDEAQDAWAVIDELKSSKVWVMISAPSADRAADGAEPRWSTLPSLLNAGIPYVITTGTSGDSLELIREATFAVRFGITKADALAAVTSRPAALLGIDDRVGTLQPGRDADLVVWSNDPFDPSSRALTVLVGGSPTTH
jgi:imidazolonepropionase-like amidohydrolase